METYKEYNLEQIGMIDKDWKRGAFVGRGAFGTVYKVESLKDNSKPQYVVKKFIGTDEYLESFKTETRVLESIGSHERIVPFIGTSKCDNTLLLFLKYMEMGSLRKYSKNKNGLTEAQTSFYTRQILEGLDFLHTSKPKIIHRDLKGENVLMESECHIRLTDFGISKILQDGSRTASFGVGSLRWMAPEVLGAKEEDNAKYNEKSDIWSLGCTVIEMITAHSPYKNMHDPQIVITLHKGKLPSLDTASKKLSTFLSKTINIDPTKRPAAKDLLKNDSFLTREMLKMDANNETTQASNNASKNETALASDNASDSETTKASYNVSKNETTHASDNKTTYASDNETTKASDNVSKNETTHASDNKTTYASDNETTKASDNVSKNETTHASDNETTKASDNVSKNETTHASDNETTKASDNVSDNETTQSSKKMQASNAEGSQIVADHVLFLVGRSENGKRCVQDSIARMISSDGRNWIFKNNVFCNSNKDVCSKYSEIAVITGGYNTDNRDSNISVCYGFSIDNFFEAFKTDHLFDAFLSCPQGFTALLIVLKYGVPFTKNEEDAISLIKYLLGEDCIRKYGIIVFTYGDKFDLDYDDGDTHTNFSAWCREQRDIQALFQEVDNRFVIFNNRTQDKTKVKKQWELLYENVKRTKTRGFYSYDECCGNLVLRSEWLVKQLETTEYQDVFDTKCKEVFTVLALLMNLSKSSLLKDKEKVNMYAETANCLLHKTIELHKNRWEQQEQQEQKNRKKNSLTNQKKKSKLNFRFW